MPPQQPHLYTSRPTTPNPQSLFGWGKVTIEYLQHPDGSVEPKKLGLGFWAFPPFSVRDLDALRQSVLRFGRLLWG